MGFEMPANVQEKVKKKNSGIVYGPLKDFPIEADLFLIWLTPRQAMLYSEAAGNCRWTDNPPAAIYDRPTRAALPVAFSDSPSAFCLGCAGMHIFTEISDDRILAVFPTAKAEDFARGLESITNANASMRTIYKVHKSKFVARMRRASWRESVDAVDATGRPQEIRVLTPDQFATRKATSPCLMS